MTFDITELIFIPTIVETAGDVPSYVKPYDTAWHVMLSYKDKVWQHEFYDLVTDAPLYLSDMLEIIVSDIDSIEDMAGGAGLDHWLDTYGYVGQGGKIDPAGVEAWNSIVVKRMQLEYLFGEDYETFMEAVRNGEFA